MKRFLSILLCTMMLCTMLAPLASAEGEQTTITILWWGSQTRHDLTIELVKKFEEKNPDIKVEVDYTDWNGYWTKLAAQVAGHQTPDIMQMDYQYLAQYAQNNVLAELDSYIASGALDVTNVSDSVLTSGQIGGTTYAISTGTNAPVIGYRRDLVEAAGVELPQDPTLSEYVAVAKAVYETSGFRDNYITSNDPLRFILRSYGLNLYNDDATALGFDDPKYLVDMWELALQAQDEGWGMGPNESVATSFFDSMAIECWSHFMNSNELQAYRDSSGKDIAMVTIPDPDDSTASSTYLKPSMFWAVAEESENKDAAVRFLNFFTNDPDCFDIVGVERAIPISSEMREHIIPNLDEVSQEVIAFVDYVSLPGMASPLMNADPAAHSDVTELLNQYSEQVRYGLIDDLTAYAQQFIEEANAILAKAAEAAEAE